MTATPAERAEFLSKLDDQPKGNKSLMFELGWDKERYSRVKQSLLDNGIIEKRKGKYGSVIKTGVEESDIPMKETKIYKTICDQMHERWQDDNSLDDSGIISTITALQGRKTTGGKWSRPDITIVTFKKYAYVPFPTLEVVTFELKTDPVQMNVSCVYEALSHYKSVHKAYVVLVTGNASFEEVMSNASNISEECGKYGIGLIVIDNMQDYETWETILDAQRHEPDPEKLNDFIATQLREDEKRTLTDWYSNKS
ncbi:MAG: hypothetical protein K8I60_02235 [Anaerolineae bacterium]|nr:hypothetical protein [Anaerolineae bacterium]